MKIMVTLDFAPERGGIQNYLGEIVRHTFSSSDMVFVGAAGKVDQTEQNFPCPIRYFSTFLSKWNKKLSLISMLTPLFLTLRSKRDKKINIECGNVYAAVAPYLLSFFFDVNYSVYSYGTELIALRKKNIRSLFLIKVLKKAQVVFVLGSYTQQLLRECGYDGEVRVVTPKIQLPGVVKEKVDISKKLRILTVGRLVYHKGHDLLLKALSSVDKYFDWTLVIAGTGQEKNRLLRLSCVLGVGSRVEILEGLTDSELSEQYSLADLFVLYSRECREGTEGFGIVLLEAMAHRIPIIASRAGGIPDVLDNGECGMLVEPHNPQKLKDAIDIMARDKEMRLGYVEKAQNRLRELYVW
ncbi:Glycosyl transferase [Chitinispirillum alkaliphilum]|nr:Glycosyl transferase [Chitinispirillum alkaliphilum]